MNIIDHLSLGVDNLEQAEQFYTPLLSTLGITALAKSDAFVAYGTNAVQFLIMAPENGQPASQGNGTHICFRANSATEVSAFHSIAISTGGSCAGEPGPREAYPMPEVFTAFVRDPFDNKLEAISGGFAGASSDE